MRVTLREKKLINYKASLYLDFYPPIIVDGKETRREFLKLYIYQKPRNETEREHNKETRVLADSIRSKRQLELQANPHGFISSSRKKSSFLTFLKSIVEQKKNLSKSTFETWNSVYDHLHEFTGGKCSFAEINLEFAERFNLYLQNCEAYAVRHKKRNEKPDELKKKKISANTARSYFSFFTFVLTEACKKHYLSFNPALEVKQVKAIMPKREFLTLDELKALYQTQCRMPDELRNAALFSALTGLRFSDIKNLTWANVRDDETEPFLIFRIQKTNEPLNVPISHEARELLGERKDFNQPVFNGLKYNSYTNNFIEKWTKAAGIERRLTFHAFRHSFATGQITLGTDIFTVSKMLGHSNVKTTQIYARLVDEKKRVAANKISLK